MVATEQPYVGSMVEYKPFGLRRVVSARVGKTLVDPQDGRPYVEFCGEYTSWRYVEDLAFVNNDVEVEVCVRGADKSIHPLARVNLRLVGDLRVRLPGGSRRRVEWNAEQTDLRLILR